MCAPSTPSSDAPPVLMAEALDVVATRMLDTPSGTVTVVILRHRSEAPAFEYRLVDAEGRVAASTVTYGVDSMQALLFCLAAAGDHLRAAYPDADFAELGTTSLLVTDLGRDDVWRAAVAMPARG